MKRKDGSKRTQKRRKAKMKKKQTNRKNPHTHTHTHTHTKVLTNGPLSGVEIENLCAIEGATSV